MSLQVSYKRQFVFLFMLTLTFLIVVEVLANIWLYNFYRCDFEDNELFEKVDYETKRRICIESLSLEYFDVKLNYVEGWTGARGADNFREGLNNTIVTINGEGFRGPEFTKNKPENTFRIFAIGGSTTLGTGIFDNQTWPFFLQQKFDEKSLTMKIEVINSGWPGWWSLTETKIIKKRWVDYEPDLFLVFDGHNDVKKQIQGFSNALADLWLKRWLEICQLGMDKNFDTVIVIQPIIGTGNKILTQQETEFYLKKDSLKKLELYPAYQEKLEELNNKCTTTADFTKIFDKVQSPVYFDNVHTGLLGNKIIAENFYELIFPIVYQKTKNLTTNSQENLFIENDFDIKSNEFDSSFEEIYLIFQNVISSYKTPKIIPLIFE